MSIVAFPVRVTDPFPAIIDWLAEKTQFDKFKKTTREILSSQSAIQGKLDVF